MMRVQLLNLFSLRTLVWSSALTMKGCSGWVFSSLGRSPERCSLQAIGYTEIQIQFFVPHLSFIEGFDPTRILFKV